MNDTSDNSSWTQVNIAFPGQNARERERQAVAHLARVLPPAETAGLITSWFFIRKGRWRVRYRPAETRGRDSVRSQLIRGVDWTGDIYEPEIHAFGGHPSMDTAHKLFHADSRHLLTFLNGTPADRRERSLILCTALMRAAGLEFGEQGDVWAQIAEQRSVLRGELPDPATWSSFTNDVRQLLTGQAQRDDIGHDWLTAFQNTGGQLKSLREHGQLTRGIRAVTALHVIFHWNRIGLTGPTQAMIAQAAKDAIFTSG
ncbi:thiopeptide-type bacteriocin biosynthesis protein [Actinomadura bangladeshensis]|uniref:Bacteriocin biosynthesis protein n=1 Tax=Actinomadura bangladeshensis TaxID=453573 RepID=A0A4R4N8J6_9ACTN|nr:thiopeptide-type bacteriocin biosynthesis protein [Actinomadura bangladeshensis]TDC05258.1 bacteriocin biosynthesis protein [Actinomadura bangladeshensis]